MVLSLLKGRRTVYCLAAAGCHIQAHIELWDGLYASFDVQKDGPYAVQVGVIIRDGIGGVTTVQDLRLCDCNLAAREQKCPPD